MGFQTACAILQLIRTPDQYPEAETFRVEGADEAIDFEVRDGQDRPLLLAQAKTRVEPRSWSGPELVRLARRWGKADPDGTAVLRFLSDGPVHTSGQAVRDAADRARAVTDPEQWLTACEGLGTSIALTAEDHALMRRLEINTRTGPWEQILNEARVELLRLSPSAMAAAEIDGTVDALFVKMFQWSGERRLDRRTVRLDELPGLLGGRRAAPGTGAGVPPGPRRALFRDVPSATGLRGREKELAALRERFAGEPDSGTARVVVSGLGGIGKSSIARLYAHRNRGAYEFAWWIPSDTRENVIAAYRRLVTEDRPEAAEPATEAEIIAQVGRRLAPLGTRLLLVYDNVADREQLQGLLPACEGAHVLVTTRDSAWAAADGGLVVDRMTEDEATAWAVERLPRVAETEVSALVDAVERIPLGIAQAIGYVAATQCPVDVYLTELADCRARLLDNPGFVPLDYVEGVTLTAAVTLSVGRVIAQALESPDASEQQLAAELLARCALLAPDFIPLHLVALDLPAGSAVYGAVAELRRFSLVAPQDGMLAIHRIVQEVVRALMDSDAATRMRGRFQYELVEQLVDCQKRSRWAEAATLIEHAVHVAHHLRESGHADGNTVALLANVAGAISNVHGDLARSEALLREALAVVDHADEESMDDPVYRRAATTTSLAHCLQNQLRFDEAAEAARTAWTLLEGVDALDAEGVEHLLLAHVAEMRAAVATDRFADIARAAMRVEAVLGREEVPPSVALKIRLDQAQTFVWIKNWDDAAAVIELAKGLVGAEEEPHAELLFLDAIVKASTGLLEEALAVTASIPEPDAQAAVTIMRHHADQMVDAAHGLMVGSLRRREKGLPTDAWILNAAESLLDRAETLLKAHTEAGPDILAHLRQRQAVLAWTRHRLGHPDGDPDLCRALMRESLDMFEAAGQSHAPLASTARAFLASDGQDDEDELGERADADGPPRTPSASASSNGGGTHPISPFPWQTTVAWAHAAPADARSLYALLGATAYHLGEQEAPSPAFLALAVTAALRSMGLTSRMIPTTLEVTRDGAPLYLPGWQVPPTVTRTGEVQGHVTLWCEEAGRLVDPALLLGQSRFPLDAEERDVFRTPAVFPAPDVDALLSFRPATHREGHLLAYDFRPDWEEQLIAVLRHLDKTAVAAFAQQIVSSAEAATRTTTR
ncbi:ATP-binding protein [Streptomyces sp. TX20-6-3]|uniref:ATP-binding protein n=1 Tax=Streptomyces sp. TX20-6-3 TaxID=3028705 RepID=UPI0029B73456|nr:ATP-binding protein [Streptomyces sp. TX20-6-3]MDX2559599.1 ATP-binding protein [Streptomyces sp. TX20-6-3]